MRAWKWDNGVPSTLLPSAQFQSAPDRFPFALEPLLAHRAGDPIRPHSLTAHKPKKVGAQAGARRKVKGATFSRRLRHGDRRTRKQGPGRREVLVGAGRRPPAGPARAQPR